LCHIVIVVQWTIFKNKLSTITIDEQGSIYFKSLFTYYLPTYYYYYYYYPWYVTYSVLCDIVMYTLIHCIVNDMKHDHYPYRLCVSANYVSRVCVCVCVSPIKSTLFYWYVKLSMIFRLFSFYLCQFKIKLYIYLNDKI